MRDFPGSDLVVLDPGIRRGDEEKESRDGEAQPLLKELLA